MIYALIVSIVIVICQAFYSVLKKKWEERLPFIDVESSTVSESHITPPDSGSAYVIALGEV